MCLGGMTAFLVALAQEQQDEGVIAVGAAQVARDRIGLVDPAGGQ
jgi:hypothetical protein